MAFTEFEKKKYEMIVSEFIKKRRPPLHVRDKVDLNFRIEEQSVEIFEIRPMWQNPENWQWYPQKEKVLKNFHIEAENVHIIDAKHFIQEEQPEEI